VTTEVTARDHTRPVPGMHGRAFDFTAPGNHGGTLCLYPWSDRDAAGETQKAMKHPRS
jgi:hypothetical protein